MALNSYRDAGKGPGGNPRGKKTVSPGYQVGNHWVTCDSCGFAIRAEDIRLTWDNRQVCYADWEPRQPQDFVRSLHDNIAAEDPVRPDPAVIFIPDDCIGTAIVGISIIGIAIVGSDCGREPTGFVPTVPTNTL